MAWNNHLKFVIYAHMYVYADTLCLYMFICINIHIYIYIFTERADNKTNVAKC